MPYSVDFGKFDEENRGIYWIEGWILEPEQVPADLEAIDENNRPLPCEIRFRERPDVVQALGNPEAGGQIGFSVRIPGLTEHPDFQRIILKTQVEGRPVVLFQKNMKEILREWEEENLRLQIDNVQTNTEGFWIRGWAADVRGESVLSLFQEDGTEIPFAFRRTERPDIVALYGLENEGSAYGFVLRISQEDFPKDKMIVQLQEGTVIKQAELNGRKVRHQGWTDKFRRQAIKIREIPSALRRIREHGWERYAIEKKRASHPEYENYSVWFQEHRLTDQELAILKKTYDVQIRALVRRFTVSANAERTEEITWERLGEKLAGREGKPGRWLLLTAPEIVCEEELPYRAMEYLRRNPGKELIYFDHDENRGEEAVPFIKPGWNLELLRGWNYPGRCVMIREELLRKICRCGIPAGFHDLLLKASEQTEAVGHIARPLFHVAGPVIPEESRMCIQEHLKRCGLEAEVTETGCRGLYRVKYLLREKPLVSIVILNKDHKNDLRNCINSILDKTTYASYEILIGENNSRTEEIFRYYQELESAHDNIHVYYWKDDFNYSAINNMLVQKCRGEYVVLLNNDIEVITPDWLENMLSFCQQRNVGAVGAKLYYPDHTVQHAGVVLGLGGIAGHILAGSGQDECGYMNRLITDQEVTIVTAACLMVRKKYYEQAGGMEERLKVAFNDVDFCMKLRRYGFRIIFTPYTELYHYESKSRGKDNTASKIRRFGEEVTLFEKKWSAELKAGDPFYSPVLTLKKNDCSFKDYEEEKNDGKF